MYPNTNTNESGLSITKSLRKKSNAGLQMGLKRNEENRYCDVPVFSIEKKTGKHLNGEIPVISGVRETIRTSDTQLRRLVLYPTELHEHFLWDRLRSVFLFYTILRTKSIVLRNIFSVEKERKKRGASPFF